MLIVGPHGVNGVPAECSAQDKTTGIRSVGWVGLDDLTMDDREIDLLVGVIARRYAGPRTASLGPIPIASNSRAMGSLNF